MSSSDCGVNELYEARAVDEVKMNTDIHLPDFVQQLNGMILSFGGGVNSTALAILLVSNGWSGEIVFADTGCEWPETYCYMEYFENTWLKPRGFAITKLRGLPWQTNGKNGESLLEYCKQLCIIPMMAVRWCTVEWKVKPLQRYAGEREIMLGICADEAHRQKGRICPLIDLNVTRLDCIRIIHDAGLATPLKSGCYICPFQSTERLRKLYFTHPELYEQAAELERLASAKANRRVTLDPRDISLDEKRERFASQLMLPELDEEEFAPCVCGL